MMEYRARTIRSEAFVEKFKGAAVNPAMINIKLEGPARITKPNGKPLAVFLPGAVKDLATELYEPFSSIRLTTDNRGYASGGTRVKKGTTRTRAPIVTSAILGSVDMDNTKQGQGPICRLTAFNAQKVNTWNELQPMFQRIAEKLEENVPDRYAAQARVAANTADDWIIKGTPFTTITVNNTYPTGIHTDKGDLDEGFSTLACIRRGNYKGGWITFPQYGIAADMQDGDLLLMDAHEWHGNTALECGTCGANLTMPNHWCDPALKGKIQFTPPERISIVSYFRTKIEECGTREEEDAKRQQIRNERNLKVLGLEYGES